MFEIIEQPVVNFHLYPSVGQEDWQYCFATAEVRTLGAAMLSKTELLNMANAVDFADAVDLLSSGEYALPAGAGLAEIENILLAKRSDVRKLATDLMDEPVAELFRARDDFANMRLALRRTLTDKELGIDYSSNGNVPAERFEDIFGREDYYCLPFYLAEAVEEAVLGYYQNKDIRQIDYAIDSAHARHNIATALRLENQFLLELFRMQIDLTNIRTMLRLKFTESQLRDVFLAGGYIDPRRLKHCIEIDYEAIAPLFFASPYYPAIEQGVSYLAAEKSFLKLESCCWEYVEGFLDSTDQISAGIQPVIAYLLKKENEIRTVRLLLTAKKNFLDTKLILDRIS